MFYNGRDDILHRSKYKLDWYLVARNAELLRPSDVVNNVLRHLIYLLGLQRYTL